MRVDEMFLKAAFIHSWRSCKRINRNSILASEMTLGTNRRRADLVILGDHFIGVEIKSDYDDVQRLSGQLDIYTRCFDEVFVITTHKHAAICDRIAPKSVCVMTIDINKNLAIYRNNTQKCEPCSQATLKLLTTPELRSLIGEKNTRIARRELLRLASEEPFERIRSFLIARFERNHKSPSELFWRTVGRKAVRETHLTLLSRFAGRREENSLLRSRQDMERSKWIQTAKAEFGLAAE